ncbi:MAG: hypothetical protein NC254_13215 [bacterium]|nr:hypothetical protein [bacterium]
MSEEPSDNECRIRKGIGAAMAAEARTEQRRLVRRTRMAAYGSVPSKSSSRLPKIVANDRIRHKI